MADISLIQWTKSTWNPWHGCKKVSPGCKFCYMYRDKKNRFNQDPTVVHRSRPATFNAPLRWKELAFVFTCSWSDFFIKEADEWRPDAWDIIRRTPHLIYQILTKRPERIKQCLPPDWGDGWQNVWIGTSVENQKTFNKRVPILAEIPAHVRFLSVEPLIAPIAFADVMQSGSSKYPFNKIGWVIVGGESGNMTGEFRFRSCSIEWIESIVKSCESLSIPVFVKQTGTSIAIQNSFTDRHGGDISEWPASIRVRQFPDIVLQTPFGKMKFDPSLFLL